ncbi:hypothetical protein HK097_010739 [Rhizophlyctis rosea]|uniref:DNA (cytosine-5-)-methyltransferase n=1 Tax=Rhizophlyctis rosea TaxID=64517 RepID=A0AAD5WZL5_9FUNG|nr:hypothetical protein HK097_010739 [Rhizophlyctis rosea]
MSLLEASLMDLKRRLSGQSDDPIEHPSKKLRSVDDSGDVADLQIIGVEESSASNCADLGSGSSTNDGNPGNGSSPNGSSSGNGSSPNGSNSGTASLPNGGNSGNGSAVYPPVVISLLDDENEAISVVEDAAGSNGLNGRESVPELDQSTQAVSEDAGSSSAVVVEQPDGEIFESNHVVDGENAHTLNGLDAGTIVINNADLPDLGTDETGCTTLANGGDVLPVEKDESVEVHAAPFGSAPRKRHNSKTASADVEVEVPRTNVLNRLICNDNNHAPGPYFCNKPHKLIDPDTLELTHEDIDEINDYEPPVAKIGVQFYEFRLDHYAIVDFHQFILDELQPTFFKKVRKGYWAVGTLRHADQSWTMKRYFRFSKFELNTMKDPHPDVDFWIYPEYVEPMTSNPRRRHMNGKQFCVRLGKPRIDYVHFHENLMNKCLLTTRLVTWLHKQWTADFTIDRLNGREEGRFLHWMDQQAKYTYDPFEIDEDESEDSEDDQPFKSVVREYCLKKTVDESSEMDEQKVPPGKDEQKHKVVDIYLSPLVNDIFEPDAKAAGATIKLLKGLEGLKPPDFANRRKQVPIPDHIRRQRRDIYDDFECVGEPVSTRGKITYYGAFRLRGKTYKIGDDVLVETPENERGAAWDTKQTEASVCRIAKIWWGKDEDGAPVGWVKVYWYYYQNHTLYGDVYKKRGFDFREVTYTGHKDDLYASMVLSHANVFDKVKKVKRWNDFWCQNFQDDVNELIRPYKPTRALEPFQKYQLQSGDVVALEPVQRNHNGISEVWEIVDLEKEEDGVVVKALGRRMYWRRGVDVEDGVARGEKNEFVRSCEEVEIKQFWERWEDREGFQIFMEFVGQKMGVEGLPREKLPMHLQHFLSEAGAVAFFRHEWNMETKELISITDATERESLQKRFPSLEGVHEMDATPLAAFELFAGTGGSSLGLEMSGATHSRWALDNNEVPLKMNAKNRLHKDKPFTVLVEEASEGLHKASNGDEAYPKPVGVDSVDPDRSTRLIDFTGRTHRNRLQYLVCLSWVHYLKPEYVFIENVFNIVTFRDGRFDKNKSAKDGRGVKFVAKVIFALRQMGYAVKVFALGGRQHGLAQKRDRVIMMAVREGSPIPAVPAVTHYGGIAMRRGIMDKPSGKKHIKEGQSKANIVGKKDAWGEDLENLSYGDVDGKRIKEPSISGERRLERTYKRYKRHEPIRTILTTAKDEAGLHYEENRGFSIRERGLLQSFPPWYDFFGPGDQRQKAIGNAVPPALGFAIGVSIRMARRRGFDLNEAEAENMEVHVDLEKDTYEEAEDLEEVVEEVVEEVEDEAEEEEEDVIMEEVIEVRKRGRPRRSGNGSLGGDLDMTPVRSPRGRGKRVYVSEEEEEVVVVQRTTSRQSRRSVRSQEEVVEDSTPRGSGRARRTKRVFVEEEEEDDEVIEAPTKASGSRWSLRGRADIDEQDATTPLRSGRAGRTQKPVFDEEAGGSSGSRARRSQVNGKETRSNSVISIASNPADQRPVPTPPRWTPVKAKARRIAGGKRKSNESGGKGKEKKPVISLLSEDEDNGLEDNFVDSSAGRGGGYGGGSHSRAIASSQKLGGIEFYTFGQQEDVTMRDADGEWVEV